MAAIIAEGVTVRLDLVMGSTGKWLAGCQECNWLPEPYFVEAIAMQDAYDHNRVRHDGAAVEQIHPAPMHLATVDVEQVRKRLRYHRVIGIGYALIPALLAWTTWGTDFAITVGMWSVLVTFYAHTWGEYSEKYRSSKKRLEQLQSYYEVDDAEGD